MTQCPSCGQTLIETCGELPIAVDESAPSAHHIQREINRIDDHVLRLHEAIARFKEDIIRLERDKVDLKRKLNDVQATTRDLPPEVLSDIFQFVRPSITFGPRSPFLCHSENLRKGNTYFRGEDFHFDLAAVSHHWRQVVWSTPPLWSSISVGIRLETVAHTMPLLDLYFRNAQGLPMSLEIDLRWIGSRTTPLAQDLLEIMMNEIFSLYSSKIGSLFLIGFPPDWTPRIVNKDLWQCVSVAVSHPWGDRPWHSTEIGGENSRICFAELPRLQQIQLVQVNAPLILPLSSMSKLDVSYVPMRVWTNALLNCPNLRELKILDHPRDRNLFSLTQSTMIENLESLTWSAECSSDYSRTFIRYCRFASLRTLVWSSSDGYFERIDVEDGEPYNEFISFVYNLPPTLTSLTFDWLYPDTHRSILDVLLCVPQVTEFKVTHSDLVYDYCEFIGQPISKFINDDYDPHPNVKHIEDSAILPRLRKLTLDYTYVRYQEKCLEMLERLYETRTDEERFYFSVNTSKRPWDKDIIVNTLRPLVASGFNLSFTLGECELDLT